MRLPFAKTIKRPFAKARKALPLSLPKADGGRSFGRKVAIAATCLVIFVLLAFPAVFVNNAIGYFPALAFAIVLLLSFVYLKLLKRGLRFDESEVGQGCLRGEKLNFSLTVVNDSILPATAIDVDFFISDLFGAERESTVRRLSLPPRSSKTFDFGVTFDHIGTYGVGIRKIQASDPFGVFRYEKPDSVLSDVSVQPRLFDVEGIEVSAEAAQESKRSITSVISDGMDYCGVREYRWGDPIKAVHWKLSASNPLDECYTRLYETNSNPGISIFLDTDSLDYDAEGLMCVYDTLVESALSLEQWASQFGYETDVRFLDEMGQSMRFDGPLLGNHAEVLDQLPRVRRGSGFGFVELVRSKAASIYAKNNFVICSACISDALIGEIIRIHSSRLKPILIAVVPPSLDEDAKRELRSKLGRLTAAQVECAIVSGAAELSERG
ncbi:MAG: DUF58 domain-containing protein [Eggerthellaceae bacterium]|nr:DUF58 domain-containing protein [Eggerthellaceae bacterium]